MSFVNMGFGNIINSDKIVAVISPDSAPSKRLLQNSKELLKLQKPLTVLTASAFQPQVRLTAKKVRLFSQPTVYPATPVRR